MPLNAMSGADHGRARDRSDSAASTEIRAWRQSQLNPTMIAGDVTQDIAKKVGCNNHIKALRTADEIHRGGIDQQGFGRDFRVFGSNSRESAIPQHHPVALRVGFGDTRDALLTIALTGELKSIASDAVHATASEERSCTATSSG